MNPWRPYPLLRILLPFLSGIISGICYQSVFSLPVTVFPPALFVCFCLILLSKRLYGFAFRGMTGLVIVIFSFFLGSELSSSALKSADRPEKIPEDGWYLLEISEPPLVRTASVKVMVAGRFIYQQNQWKPVKGNYSLQLKMNFSERPLFCGDFLYAYVVWQKIRNTANPFSFNYAAYLAGKGIYYQSWIENRDWIKVNLRTADLIRSFSFSLRNRLLEVLRKNSMEGQEFAVAAALLLGYVDELDPGLKKAYSATGAMHILSVSGMHVGIIYLFFNVIFGYMDRRKFLRVCKTILMLLLIWFYAFLTGLSPSVLRAATMLSFIITGKALSRTPETFNILAASLLFILILDPLIIRDLGFQLSYLAVGGICLLYQPVYDWVVTSGWLWDKIWSVLAVSIVAQLATCPVSLYYFHQFPNFFLLTNLFVVPLSSLIIYLGILALGFGTVPIISICLTKILGGLVWILNFVIQGIEQLPFSTSRGIYLTLYEMLMLYLILILVYILFMKRRFGIIFPVIICLIVLESSFLYRKIGRLMSNSITVYNIKGMACFEFSGNSRAALMYDFRDHESFATRLDKAVESIMPAWDALDLKQRSLFWLGSACMNNYKDPLRSRWIRNGSYIQFETKRIGILNGKIPKHVNSKLNLDFLIISGNPMIHLQDVLRVYKVQVIIIDATNYTTRIERWVSEAGKLGIRCHAVSRDGAFVYEF